MYLVESGTGAVTRRPLPGCLRVSLRSAGDAVLLSKSFTPDGVTLRSLVWWGFTGNSRFWPPAKRPKAVGNVYNIARRDPPTGSVLRAEHTAKALM